MKFVILFFIVLFSFKSYAAPKEATRPAIYYQCSEDSFAILGTDGSNRSCWPYICRTEGEADKDYGTGCLTYCHITDHCQPGTACDLQTHRCVKAN